MIATLQIQTGRIHERESLDCFPEFIFRFYENPEKLLKYKYKYKYVQTLKAKYTNKYKQEM